MCFFGFFRKIKKRNEEYIKAEKECIARIKNTVAEKCGTDKFIDCGNSAVAFAGSEEHKELLLELYTTKDKNGTYLNAVIDGFFGWDEGSFNSLIEFENDIAEHIANRVNRTIKTVTITEKHKRLQEKIYYLNEETNEWIMIEEVNTEDKMVCRLFADKTETVETVRKYELKQ